MHYEKKIMWSISGNVIDFDAKCPRIIVEIRESIRTVVFLHHRQRLRLTYQCSDSIGLTDIEVAIFVLLLLCLDQVSYNQVQREMIKLWKKYF